MARRDKNANKHLHRKGLQMKEKLMGVQIPGQARIQVEMTPGPNVSPITVNAQVAGGLIVKQFGGLSKLEEFARDFAAALVQSEKSRGMDRTAIAAAAVDLATLVLAECERVQTDPPAGSPAGEEVAGAE